MIQKFQNWSEVNEVEELTEERPRRKYVSRIIEAYKKMPNIRPSRDPKQYFNAKKLIGTKMVSSGSQFAADVENRYQELRKSYGLTSFGQKQPESRSIYLWEFMQNEFSANTWSDILIRVIEEWYQWPDESRAKQVLINYITNDDDLQNLTVGNVALSDPTQIPGYLAVGKSALKVGKTLLKDAPKDSEKLFKLGARLLKRKKLNEGLIIAYGLAELATGAWKYVAYGDYEYVEDNAALGWCSPFLDKNFVGLFGDDPLTAQYFSVFNTMMMIIYDAWNLCMGQRKYGSDDNPLSSWNTGKEGNYIDSYYQTFCEQDNDVAASFKRFMTQLHVSCINDSRNTSIFSECPWFFTCGKIMVKMKSGDALLLSPKDFTSWIESNIDKYIIRTLDNPTIFLAEPRDQPGFRPFKVLGYDKEVKGKALRTVNLIFDDVVQMKKSGLKPTLVEIEGSLLMRNDEKKLEGRRIITENVTKSDNGDLVVIGRKRKKKPIPEGMAFADIKKTTQDVQPSEVLGIDDI